MVEFINLQNRFKNIEGQMHPCEGYALYLLAAGGPGEGAIVELGSHAGHATCWLAEGSRKVNREKVVAVGGYKPAGDLPSEGGTSATQPQTPASGATPPTLRPEPPSGNEGSKGTPHPEPSPAQPVPPPATASAPKSRFTGPLAELASLGTPGPPPPQEAPAGPGTPSKPTDVGMDEPASGGEPSRQESYINLGGPLAREDSAPGAPAPAEERKGNDLKLEEGPFAALCQKADEATS